MTQLLWPLLKTFSWQELRHHPWRNAAAAVAVMLGVALAFAVHLINASALDEFSQAVRSVNGEPDLELRGAQGSFDEAVYAQLAQHPQLEVASPVLEISTYVIAGSGPRKAIRVLGVDALLIAQVAPALMPQPQGASATANPNANPNSKSNAELQPEADSAPVDSPQDRFAVFAPGNAFANAAASQLVPPPAPGTSNADATPALRLQSGLQVQTVRIAGRVNASGAPLLVMDLGAAQDLFGRGGQLSRIDLKLKPGVNREDFAASLAKLPGWPQGLTATAPADAAARISNLSRAYRVNLTVLALVALFTGAFLVFSVLSLSVAKRAQQFALLGVLGLTGRQRLQLVLLESGALGLVGSLAGIGLGTVLAALSLQILGGDLGGGYFAGVAPALHWHGGAAVLYGGLGLLAALAGGWWPAAQAQKLPPAQTLKGLGLAPSAGLGHWISLILIAASVALAKAPAVFDIPLAAYASVALLLVGGITLLPWLIGVVLDGISPHLQTRLMPLLAVERARRLRGSASVAVSGVVASLSLAVALTVMVASFRGSVTEWLNTVLPADLYVRTATSSAAGDTVFFPPELVAAISRIDGVQQLSTQRTLQLQLDSAKPAVALVVRPLPDVAKNLPLVGNPLPVPSGQVGVYVSEAMVDLYNAQPGGSLRALNIALAPSLGAQKVNFFIAGVWRDYARQAGTIAIDQSDYERLTQDRRVNDVALWLKPGSDVGQVQQAVRDAAAVFAGAVNAPKAGDLAGDLAAGSGSGPSAVPSEKQPPAGQPASLVEFASSPEIRAISLKIFDRSFAVTYWLQGVAIGIGLFGIAASFSAQVLARRKEFGLLVHLGLTRRQILTVVAGEGLAWTAIGALAGLALGLAVSVVLVHVVNPQSFHWTMDLAVPWPRLALLCLAVVVAGTATAALAARAAAGRDAVLAVKEDW